MRLDKVYLRSAEAQLWLLGGVLLGGVLLAVAALGLRGVFFDRHVRQKFEPLSGLLQKAVSEVAAGKAGCEELKRMNPPEFERVYAAWVTDPGLDPSGRIGPCLLSAKGRFVLDLVRRTLVCGNKEQRSRAISLLGTAVSADLRTEAVSLCEFARDRSRRWREEALAREAETALAALRRPKPGP